MIKEIFLKLKIVFIPVKENNFRPKFLDSNFLIYYLAVLLIVKFAILPFFFCFYQTSFFASLTKEALVNLTNQERRFLGLSDLQSSRLLDSAAALKAQDMLNLDYFGHSSPEGKTPWHWINLVGYDYQKAGENLAIGFIDGEEVMKAWQESPSHRANIINSGYKEIGIGIAKGDYQGQEITVVVQMFGSKKENIPEKSAKLAVFSEQDPQAGKNILSEEKSFNGKLNKEVAEQPKEEKNNHGQPSSFNSVLSEEEIKEPQSAEFLDENPSKEKNENEEKKEQAVLAHTQNIEAGWQAGLLRFLTFDYSKIIEKATFFSLLVVMLGMVLSTFIEIRIQHKDLMLKGTFFTMVFGILLLFDKIIILRFIPHNLIIS